MGEVLIACDPSYNRSGITVFSEGRLVVTEVRGKEVIQRDVFSKSFDGIYRESFSISVAIKSEIRKAERSLEVSDIKRADRILISECPPPQGQYSPGLYALDTRLFSIYDSLAAEVYTVYPNYLMHLHGKRDYSKSESVILAKEIMKEFDTKILSKRFSHDEAESVIFLSRLLYKKNLLPVRIIDLIPNIKDSKEILFNY